MHIWHTPGALRLPLPAELPLTELAGAAHPPGDRDTLHTHSQPSLSLLMSPKQCSAQGNRHPLLIPAHWGLGLSAPRVGKGQRAEALQAQSGSELIHSPRTEESLCFRLLFCWKAVWLQLQPPVSLLQVCCTQKKKKICLVHFKPIFFLHFFFQKECNFI